MISTGDELRSLGEDLEYGQIYESNSYGLSALVEIYGHEVTRFPNVIDDLDILRETLNEASKNHDCIITSGGVSMGDKDYVRILMEQEGEIRFWRVKMRPGSPPLFGLWNDKPLFGLPGNPVSSHVVFRAIVGKWLTSLTNSKDINTKYTHAILDEDIKTQEGFTTFRRVELFNKDSSTFARLKGHQGSGNIAGVAMSDGLTVIEPDQLGSAYLAENPPVDLANIVAGFNFDRVLPTGKTKDMAVIGYGASELEDYLEKELEKQEDILTQIQILKRAISTALII